MQKGTICLYEPDYEAEKSMLNFQVLTRNLYQQSLHADKPYNSAVKPSIS